MDPSDMSIMSHVSENVPNRKFLKKSGRAGEKIPTLCSFKYVLLSNQKKKHGLISDPRKNRTCCRSLLPNSRSVTVEGR